MAIIQVEVPSLGESINQATLLNWLKSDGERVAMDEAICALETDKANVDITATAAGILRRVAKEGDTVAVGEVIARIDSAVGAATATTAPTATPTAAAPVTAQPVGAGTTARASAATSGGEGTQARGGVPAGVELGDYSPAVRVLIEEHRLDPRAIPANGPNGRLTKEDVEAYLAGRVGNGNGRGAGDSASAGVVDDEKAPEAEEDSPPPMTARRAGDALPQRKKESLGEKPPAAAAPKSPKAPELGFDANGLRRTPMSKIRKRIAETLVNAQQTAAILTTFNEVDLQAIMDLRAKYKDRFNEVHGVGLGFMSFFAKAAVLALREYPRVNAFIDGDDVVYHQYAHLGIAVSTDRGLLVPVMRNVENMGFARIEAEIKRLAAAARDNKLSLQDLTGATFTITNGGVFGSLLSTPILTPPQSGILGMHAIQQRPVAINGKVEVRPMMYVALSYDHRLVDGRESVSFLVRLKQYLEDPARLMLEV